MIDYLIRFYSEQGVKELNQEYNLELINFFRDRMKNILKEKKIRPDIIEASLSSHLNDNFLELYKKTLL